jgi:hypothetical protein
MTQKLTAAPSPTARIGLTEKEIAEALGLSLTWIQHDRIGRRILPYFRIGGAIRYSPERVRAALERLQEGGAH